MKLWLRMLGFRFRIRREPGVKAVDVDRTAFRVWPTDLDVLRHMNNGVYLTLMDLGRVAMMRRSGFYEILRAKSWYPVVVAETITFRRSLELWQRFNIETRIIGSDDVAVYVEQRFVSGNEIHAQAFVRARFLKRGGGVVTPNEILQAAGVAATEVPELPEWVAEWAAGTALPRNKVPTPSTW